MNARAAISMPRIGFTDHIWCALDAFGANMIELDRAHGVFWHYGLTRLMEGMLAEGAEWIFTTDYDTLFNAGMVAKMLEIATGRDDIDALCAMQLRRDMEQVMGIPAGRTENGLLRMKQAHFGLTLFRASSLASLPKPWFHSVPDKDGGWGPESIHPDIYFWKNWEAAGHTLYQASKIPVGHLQLMGSWPKKGGGVIHQHVADWHKAKQPPEGAIGT